ncbi:UNVERIFIED_CONTAM: hypothetical protein FKN15_047077 [Acipenser sinensis]
MARFGLLQLNGLARMFVLGVLAGFSVVSILTYGYLSWENLNSIVHDRAENEIDKPTSQPHIIFILADDQGFRDVGYHGSEFKTPTIDRLAAEGVKLENYYVQPMCTPSRSQFITGSPGICGYDLHEGENAAWEHDNGIYSTIMYTQKVVDILASHNPRKPLFLYLAFQAVHSPLQVPSKYLEHYKSITNLHRRKYAAMVTCLDEAINNVTLALKKYGYYDNSIIVYSSDNGGQPMAGGSNWPLRGSKGTYWEGGIRAVGFVHSPLLLNKGTLCRGLLHITDWYPTLVTLAEGQLEEDLLLDGYDVWETISEGMPSPRLDILHNIDPIYTKAKNGSFQAGYGIWNTAIQAAIRVGDWKLLTGIPGYSDWVPPQAFSGLMTNRWHKERVYWGLGKSVWLFNITADPYERVDLSRRYPHIVKQLLLKLALYNKTAVPVRYPPKDTRSNPQLNGGVWGPWYKDDEGKSSLVTNHVSKKKQKKKLKTKNKLKKKV